MSGFNVIDKYWNCHRWNIYNSGNYRKLFVESLVSFMKKDICRCIDQILATEIYIFLFSIFSNQCYHVFFSKYPWSFNGMEKKFWLLWDQLGKILSYPVRCKLAKWQFWYFTSNEWNIKVRVNLIFYLRDSFTNSFIITILTVLTAKE